MVKLITKFSSFPVQKFSNLFFFESLNKNMKKTTSYFIQICPCFVSTLLYILLIIIFGTDQCFGEISWNPCLSKKIILLKLAKLLSRLNHRIKFSHSSNERKYLLPCAKILFFSNFRFWRKSSIKPLKINWIRWSRPFLLIS